MYGDTQPMFDSDETRRAEALSQAVMSSETSEVTEAIVARAAEFEKYLRDGVETTQVLSGDGTVHKTTTRPKNPFEAYQERGLDDST